MGTLGVDKLRQHAAKILLLRWHAEQNALGTRVPVKGFDIGYGQTPVELPRRRVQASVVSPVSNPLHPGDSKRTRKPSTSR